ncbi:MAG TPA: hypothetical protein VMS86_10625 [Thermoanaerobaculia bacterium]|nr:hypothetical protein [Thermoanaerobaculia bacterium]
MSRGQRVAQLLRQATAAETLSLRCRCGESLTLAANLAGRRGRCPRCDRWLRPPCEKRGGGEGESTHPMKAAKVALMDPTFAPAGSAYYSAQLHTFVPGMFHLLAWGALISSLDRPGRAFLATLGFPADVEAWVLGVWLLGLLLGANCCALPVARAYARFSGRPYAGDRKGYAEAGCFDVVRWIPLAIYATLFSAMLWLGPRAPQALQALQTPWRFLLVGAVLSSISSCYVARRVLRARFGRPAQTRHPLPKRRER